MAPMRFDGTLPVCSRNACQHTWAERCVCEELSMSKRVGGVWRVFISILQICQEHLKMTKRGKSRAKTYRRCGVFFLYLFRSPPIYLIKSFFLNLTCSHWNCCLQSACCHLCISFTPEPIAHRAANWSVSLVFTFSRPHAHTL